jgi:DNA (cytosine-5)-methyltransferase 1
MLTLRGLDRVLGDLSEMGYDARWGVLGAIHVGAPHRRDRIWIVAYANERRCKWKNSPQKRKSNSNVTQRSSTSDWWKAEPGVVRVVDGVADIVDRIECLGNGQVPSVAATAWKILGGE